MAKHMFEMWNTHDKLEPLGFNWGFLSSKTGVIICNRYHPDISRFYPGNYIGKDVIIETGGGIPPKMYEKRVPKDPRLALLNKTGFYAKGRIYKAEGATDENPFIYSYNDEKYNYTNSFSWMIDYRYDATDEDAWRTNGLWICQVDRDHVPKVALVVGRAACSNEYIAKWYMTDDATLEEVKECLKKGPKNRYGFCEIQDELN